MPLSHIMSHFIKQKQPRQENVRTEDDSATEFLCSAGQGFPPRDSSDSEESAALVAATRSKERTVDNLLAFLNLGESSPAESERLLRHRLEALKEAGKQQLQETARLHQQDLESRMLQDSLPSEGGGRIARVNGQPQKYTGFNGRHTANTEPDSVPTRHGGQRRSGSFSDLSSMKAVASTAHPQLSRSQRPFSTSAAWAHGTTVPQPFHMTLREAERKSKLLQTNVPQDVERFLDAKNKIDEVECQKKFRAPPVPGHVLLPLYHRLTEAREQTRKAGLDQRRDYLLSMQKPFSFVTREETTKEERQQQVGGSTQPAQTTKPTTTRRPIPRAVRDPGVSERLKEEELHRKIRIQVRAQDMLRRSTAPIETRPHEETLVTRSAQRTKAEALGFLDEKPTFKPRTNPRVPDFERLHKAFQKDAVKQVEKRDATRCRPFQLRTSALPPSQHRKNPETSQTAVGQAHLKRRHCLGGIISLSADTLPTYISDAARKRGAAIRQSMEERKAQQKESTEWRKQHRSKSLALKKTVAARARAMDPHRSLKEVFHEKLKQHRETDQQRIREYKRELQEMKTRVKVRPYLFEQVSQKNAKTDADRRYRDALEQAGLDEQFVKTKGGGAGPSPPLTSDEEDQGVESDTHSREGSEGQNKSSEEEN